MRSMQWYVHATNNSQLQGRDCKKGDQKVVNQNVESSWFGQWREDARCHGGEVLQTTILDHTSQFGEHLALHISCNSYPTFNEINQRNALFVPENGNDHFLTRLRRLLELFRFWWNWIAPSYRLLFCFCVGIGNPRLVAYNNVEKQVIFILSIADQKLSLDIIHSWCYSVNRYPLHTQFFFVRIV